MLVDFFVLTVADVVASLIDNSDPEAPTVTLSARVLGSYCEHASNV